MLEKITDSELDSTTNALIEGSAYCDLLLWDEKPNNAVLEQLPPDAKKSIQLHIKGLRNRIIKIMEPVMKNQGKSNLRDLAELWQEIEENGFENGHEPLAEMAINDSPTALNHPTLNSRMKYIDDSDVYDEKRLEIVQKRIEACERLILEVKNDNPEKHQVLVPLDELIKSLEKEKIRLGEDSEILQTESENIYYEKLEIFRRSSLAANLFIEKMSKMLRSDFSIQREEVTHTHTPGGLFRMMCDKRYDRVVRFEAKRKLLLMIDLFIPIERRSAEKSDEMKDFFEGPWMELFQSDDRNIGEPDAGHLHFFAMDSNNQCVESKVVDLSDKNSSDSIAECAEKYTHCSVLNTRKIVINKGDEDEREISVQISTRTKSEHSMAAKMMRKNTLEYESNVDDDNGIRIVFMNSADYEDFMDYIYGYYGIDSIREHYENYQGIQGFHKFTIKINETDYEIQCLIPEGIENYMRQHDKSWGEYELTRTFKRSVIFDLIFPKNYYPEFSDEEIYEANKRELRTKNQKAGLIKDELPKIPEQQDEEAEADKIDIQTINQALSLLLWDSKISNREVMAAYSEKDVKRLQTTERMQRRKMLRLIRNAGINIERIRDLPEVIANGIQREKLIRALNDSDFFLSETRIKDREKNLKRRRRRLEARATDLMHSEELLSREIASQLPGCKFDQNDLVEKERKLIDEALELITEERVRLSSDKLRIFRKASLSVNRFITFFAEKFLGQNGLNQESKISNVHTPGDLFAIMCDTRHHSRLRFEAKRKLVLMTLFFIQIDKGLAQRSKDMEYFFKAFWNIELKPEEEERGKSAPTYDLYYNVDPETLECTEYKLVPIEESKKEAPEGYEYSRRLYTRNIVINNEEQERTIPVQVTPRIRNEREIFLRMIAINDRDFNSAFSRGNGIRMTFLDNTDFECFIKNLDGKYGRNTIGPISYNHKGIKGFHIFELNISGKKYTVRAFTPDGMINFDKKIGQSKPEHDMNIAFEGPMIPLLFPSKHYPNINIADIFAKNVRKIRADNREREKIG